MRAVHDASRLPPLQSAAGVVAACPLQLLKAVLQSCLAQASFLHPRGTGGFLTLPSCTQRYTFRIMAPLWEPLRLPIFQFFPGGFLSQEEASGPSSL